MIDPNSGEERQLSYVNKEILDKLTWLPFRKMDQTTDGKEMLTWVILPPNFDCNQILPGAALLPGRTKVQSVSFLAQMELTR